MGLAARSPAQQRVSGETFDHPDERLRSAMAHQLVKKCNGHLARCRVAM